MIKRSWTEVSLLHTERAQEKGMLVLGRRGIVTRLGCQVCWSKEKDGGLGFGEMSPDVRSRRVREVI
ncbi:unnamed protein product [Staurois parvus]|uniref:Uncharacterized protein n=1 Tax=Staurois parvus TaxID=386267 RepID=A0ABN9CD86_9NEOB|nr:unnamed protein product [Staurois parvus]